MDAKHQLAVEKSMRVAADERLIDEHRNFAKLEQKINSKIEVSLNFIISLLSIVQRIFETEKKVKKKQLKEMQSLHENLYKEQQQNGTLREQVCVYVHLPSLFKEKLTIKIGTRIDKLTHKRKAIRQRIETSSNKCGASLSRGCLCSHKGASRNENKHCPYPARVFVFVILFTENNFFE